MTFFFSLAQCSERLHNKLALAIVSKRERLQIKELRPNSIVNQPPSLSLPLGGYHHEGEPSVDDETDPSNPELLNILHV